MKRYHSAKVIKMILEKVTRNVLYYNYEDSRLVLDAVEDYLKGMDWLVSQKPDVLHRSVSDKAYKLKNLEKLDFEYSEKEFQRSMREKDRGIRKLFRIITFNGYLLPAKGDRIVSTSIGLNRMRLINFYRARRVLHYDFYTKRGYVTEKSYSKLVKIYWRAALVCLMVFAKYDRERKEYEKAFDKVTTIDFWNRFLGLEMACDDEK